MEPIASKKSKCLLFSIFCVALLAFVLLLSWPISPDKAGPGRDRELFRYAGMILREGVLPYLGMFERKPPLIFLIAMVGDYLGSWGMWILDTLFLTTAALAFYSLAGRERRLILFPFLFVLLMRFPGLIEGGGMTRTFCASLLMMALVILRTQHKWKYLGFGFIAGSVLMLQQEEILAFLPWIICGIVQEKAKKPAILGALLGFLVPVLSIVTWLFAAGILDDFWFAAWKFNVGYILDLTPIAKRPLAALLALHRLGLLVSIAAFFVFFTYQKFHRNAGPWLHAAVFSSCLQYFASLLTGHYDGHYFLPFAPILAFSFFLLAKESPSFSSPGFPWKYWILIVFFFYGIIGETTRALRASFVGPSHVYKNMVVTPWKGILGPLRGKRGQFYVVRKPEALSLNTEFDIVSPTKWAFDYLWDQPTETFDPDGQEFEKLLSDIDRAETLLIFDHSSIHPWLRPSIQNRWNEYVAGHYQLAATASDGAKLLKRIK